MPPPAALSTYHVIAPTAVRSDLEHPTALITSERLRRPPFTLRIYRSRHSPDSRWIEPSRSDGQHRYRSGSHVRRISSDIRKMVTSLGSHASSPQLVGGTFDRFPPVP